MRCPRCRSRMKRGVADAGVPSSVRRPGFFDRGELELDLCPDCQGIWFDGGELTELLGSTVDGLPGERVRTATLVRCPSCKKDTPGGDRSCRYCGGSLKAACPRCEGTISECRFLESPLVFCRKCRGLWLTTDLLSKLHRKLIDERTEPEPASRPLDDTPEPAEYDPPPPPVVVEEDPCFDYSGTMTCVECGKEGLTTHDSMMSADGPMCDPCGHAALDREMQKFVDPNEWLEDEIEPYSSRPLRVLVSIWIDALFSALENATKPDWSDPE